MLRLFAFLFLVCHTAAWAAPTFPPVRPGVALNFPRDHGSHPDFRTEWWYITGQVKTTAGVPLGIQVTFFRSRTGIGEDSKSRFAPTQLYFAHAAIADAHHGKLRHDQKVARPVPGLVEAAQETTNIRIDDWRLRKDGDAYIADIPANGFALNLRFAPTQAILPQGDQGYSRKGPEEKFASYYYSMPQLAVSGKVKLNGKEEAVTGTAWMDHEWSSEILMPGAVGWDWVGANLDDGGALMAFRIRDQAGKALWVGATLRDARGTVRKLSGNDVVFTPNRTWRSPASGATYPVDANIRVGDITFRLQPMMDDQELDSRASTGAIYWEGAVTVLRDGKRVGAGYLELTGYTEKLRF